MATDAVWRAARRSRVRWSWQWARASARGQSMAFNKFPRITKFRRRSIQDSGLRRKTQRIRMRSVWRCRRNLQLQNSSTPRWTKDSRWSNCTERIRPWRQVTRQILLIVVFHFEASSQEFGWRTLARAAALPSCFSSENPGGFRVKRVLPETSTWFIGDLKSGEELSAGSIAGVFKFSREVVRFKFF